MAVQGFSGCTECGVQGNVSIASQASGCISCGGSMNQASIGMPAQAAVPREETIDCGPVTSYQVIMEPKYFTETRAEPATEYQDEVRYRTRTIARQVPVEVQDYRTTTVMVPKSERRTIEYSVLVPQTNEKVVELVETVPVWNEVVDTYTVRVPTVVDVPEEYTVRVPQLRDEQFTFTVFVPQTHVQSKMHTVTNAVPVTRTRTVQVSRPITRMQTVTKDYGHWEVRVEEVAVAAAPSSYAASPACGIPSGISMGGCGVYAGTCGSCGGCGQVYSTTGMGCRVSSTCGGCGGCGSTPVAGGCSSVGTGCSGCASNSCHGACTASTPSSSMVAGQMVGGASGCGSSVQTVSRRVWVPNVVTEEVPVVENVSEIQEVQYTAFEQQTEQVPYECTYIVYAPEERTGMRKVVDYVPETRTRTRKAVQYNDETRTRTRKELSYKQETRTEKIPYVTYTTEKRTKEVSFIVNEPQTNVEPITTTRFETIQEEITEEYTVRIPVATSKEVQVQVCRMVPKLVPVTIYPCSMGSSLMPSSSPCTTCGGSPTVAPSVISPACTQCGTSGCSTCPR
jgi:hypothetical protein